MRRTRSLLRWVTVSLLGATLTGPAQAYPDKPIRLVVSIAAGSVTDVIMRAAANELNARLGQPLIIENKGGASGILGAQACAQAAPDGYTLCVIYHSTMTYNPLLFDKLPYDADADLTPVARLFLLSEGLFVSSKISVNSVAELKTLAQTKSHSLNFATLGEGSFPDLFRVWLNNQWNTGMVGVPYKGGGPAAQALLAGEVELTRFGIGNFMGALETGKVKALAVHTEQRSPLLPNVPTFSEVGLNYSGQGWWGLAVPKRTPPEIVARLNEEFVRLFQDPKFTSYLETQSVVAAPTTPDDFAKFIREDRKAAQSLIRDAKTPKTEYRQ
jgi:tripartite-type tricarboxylate transporter receptor subunit TctC